MINVSTQLKKESLTNRNYYVTANVTLSDGTTLKLGKKDFYLSGNSLVDSADSGDFPVGVAIEKTASLSLVNDDGRFDNCNFNGARFVIFLNLQLSDKLETIKRGTYIVSKKPATASEISLSLLDKMHNADKAYDSNLSFPCTVKELLSECCQQCNITLGDTTFPNSNFQIQHPPSSTTYRTVIGMCAGIAGGNARIDENDLLRIITFDKTFTNATIYDGGTVKNWTNGDDLDGGTLNPWTTGTVIDGGTLDNNDYHALFSIQNLQYDVDDIIVTGVKYVEDETEYMSGQDGYVITIDNQLFSGNAQAGVEAIGNQLIGLRMRPFSCDGIANGYATFGDPVEFIDTKNRVFRSFATNVEFVFGGSTSWSCSAKSAEEDTSEFIGEQQAAVEQAKKDTEKKLSAYDVKLKQMNELAANTLGFFYTEEIQEDGSVITYRHDKPTLADSKVIYKTSVDGFFLSVDGGQTWKAGFDSNGDAVLNILYAIGIQSEWINTRGFTAKDNNGNTTLRIDADTGAVTLEVENFTLKSRTIEQIAKDVANEAVQNNVIIPNYYGTYVPTLQNYPASEWKSEEYEKHDGSIFMNFSTSQVYMFSGTDGTWQELDAEKIVNFERVFNALTDNGKQEGIYMQNGHLYINASYIKSGQISADLINLKNINVTNSSGTSTFAIDSYGNVSLRPTTFVLANGDTIYSIAENKASTALSNANRYTDNALSNLDIGKMSKQEIINVLSDNSSNKGLYLSNGNVYMNADYINTGELAGWIVDAANKTLKSYGTKHGGAVELNGEDGYIYAKSNLSYYIPGYGTVYGTSIKGATIETGDIYAAGLTTSSITTSDISTSIINATNTITAGGIIKSNSHIEARSNGHFYCEGTGTDLADASIRGELTVAGVSRLNKSVQMKNIGTGSGTDLVLTPLSMTGGGFVFKKASSSKRYKKHLSFMEESDVKNLYDLRPVFFEYKEGYLMENDPDNKRKIPGFYAELVEKYFPDAVKYNEKGQVEDWDPKKLLPAVFELVRLQKQQLDSQQETINNLIGRIEKLEKES
ncbi:MAG: tail fiber domain-containing protein [Lachnospiraceae bacterium]|nr:tail fiber domain-containing protein [Lachnospiraceae bacterium]